MNLLFLTPYVPNPVRVRPFHLIRTLARQGHNVHLLTLTTSPEDEHDLKVLREQCRTVLALPMPAWKSALNCLAALPGGGPLQAVYSWNPALARAMEARLGGAEPLDVVHVEHLRASEYAMHAEQICANLKGDRPAVVWDSVDNISLLFQQAAQRSTSLKSRLLTRFELPRTERREKILSGHFDRILVTSRSDQDAFLRANPQADSRLRILPNGVDVNYFAPNPSVRREPNHIVISGKMSYHANVSMVLRFVENILPRIWTSVPEARLTVVGKDPHPALVRLGQDPRIQVTGTVDDIRPYLWRASVAAAPLTYGVGIQNKVLEAMACATPVISTPQAIAALAVEPGRDVLCADSDESMAGEILALFKDPDRQAALGAAGCTFIRSHHRWEQIVSNLEVIYGEAVEARRLAVT